MSTPPSPPPPSNEPPQGFGAPVDPPAGGFGAPVEPPAGGFGAPQPPQSGQGYGYPPQAPPGYGYPQQPGQPYAPQQGGPYGAPQQGQPYGYPQQPGGPYGGPPQPATQPMYGAGAPAPKGPGGNERRKQLSIVLAAVLAIALIVGGGLWYASGSDEDTPGATASSGGTGGDGKGEDGKEGSGGGGSGDGAPAVGAAVEKAPADTKAKLVHKEPQPKIERLHNVAGSWLTDSVYAKTGIREIVGYDLATMKPKWTVELPGQLCAAAKQVYGDRTAIAFEPAARKDKYDRQGCSEVAALDLAAGKLLWKGSAKGGNSGDEKTDFKEITLTRKTVAAGGLAGGAAWSLADGKSLWVPKADAENCYDMGYGGGDGLAVIRKCGDYGSQYLLAQSLDETTGAPRGSYRMPQGIQWAQILSARPLVVSTDLNNSGKISDIFSVDDRTGALRARIGLAKGLYAPNCSSGTGVETCNKYAVGNGRIYLPTAEHDDTAGKYDRTNEIVSFDLATGKQTGDRADAGSRYSVFPLRMDGPNLIAYKWPPYNAGGQVVSIDPKTMKETLLLENPADSATRSVETGFSSNFAEVRYHKGWFFASEVLIDKPYRPEDAERDFLFAGFKAG
ncbi:hypothetical protein [Streptomyces sp. NPDC097619]|uniref:hypothetical protein n=1 Tax=Streptomyces sp. NPDC097619 TaxID=3157228 RepID=UPI00332111CA